MKNRTLIGIICIVIAVAATFIVGPLVNKAMEDKVKVLTVTKEIEGGGMLSKDNVKTVQMNRSAVPEGAVTDIKNIQGYFAKTKIYAGDVLTEGKITKQSVSAEDIFAVLDGTEVAVSFTIDSFAAGLSGKLKNGDIISLIVTDKSTGETNIPPELKYVRVVTTTTSKGVDRDGVEKEEDGSSELPSTVTVLANVRQAKLIASYETGDIIQAVLVCRGESKNAKEYLKQQKDYLDSSWGGEHNG